MCVVIPRATTTTIQRDTQKPINKSINQDGILKGMHKKAGKKTKLQEPKETIVAGIAEAFATAGEISLPGFVESSPSS